MSCTVLFNKPYGVICQFSDDGSHPTLKKYIDIPNIYAAGRLDTDSEGLLILTDDGDLQHRLAHPHHKLPKTYWVQVEGTPDKTALASLMHGVDLGDFTSRPAQAQLISEPADLWPRTPPIRQRMHIPTSWLSLTIREGKNRQVRRMTAKVGYPTLRLIRSQIGPFSITGLAPGAFRHATAEEISVF